VNWNTRLGRALSYAEEICGAVMGRNQRHAPRGRISNDISLVDRMCRKLKTKAGKKIYPKIKESVEAVFGQINQARGFRQFLL
jgi:hypothetical protein